ncbi:MAG: PSD1 and planctomycete cytochrome C domain-containing protein [Limisphaerales bacterium]
MKRASASLTLCLLGAAALAARAADRVDFNREVRPILSDNCFTCHGPDEKTLKARLRLDLRESALAPAKSGETAIVPGNPDASELIKRLVTADEDDHMPPAETGKKVTPAQIETLRRWIAEGAEYRAHWSLVPPVRPPDPKIENRKLEIRNPIDAFVFSRLEKGGLQPSAEADRATLVRRAALDLTGLPPSIEEVDAFINDASPKAYEGLVDRLLDSPRYGERMAVDWLDAARFADTHGYHLDSGRDMTAWRDWVIRAFNENKPFDQFTVEQLAGDLLPGATRDQRIASGFNRNHMINYEGGAIAEEYHYAYLVDRVNTTTTVWLGLTMACAQCHDHKYDPLSKQDYYRFLAFFNQVPESGLDGNRGNASPTLKLTTPEQDAELARLNGELEPLDRRLREPDAVWDAAQQSWEAAASAALTEWASPAIAAADSEGGSHLVLRDDGVIAAEGGNPAQDTYVLRLRPKSSRLTAVRLEALADDALKAKGPGRSENGNFLLSRAALRAGSGPELPLAHASASHSQGEFPVAGVLDSDPGTGWGILPAAGRTHTAVLELVQPLDLPAGAEVTLRLEFRSAFAQHAIGRLRVATTDSPAGPALRPLPAAVRELLAVAPDQRNDEQRDQLRRHFREEVLDESRALTAQRGALRRQRDELDAAIPTTMVMGEMEKPRDTFVRMRGEYDKLGDKVTAGVPAALPPLPADMPANRLALARWLVAPDHPLTARVIVNRMWQLHFGTGLVKSAEDFGSQGDWPSHPELLDWLAREFIESGWDLKHLHRLMMTSATYRQSSRVSEDLHEQDPENRLLARGPRFRLQAEFIRDQALAISGLLNGDIGGKSVSPYQPPGLWEELSMREDSRNFSAQFFVQSTGRDLYRRSMYTFIKRSSPPPQMSTFDAPDRETCSVRRPRTNTPLQALILLNDPTYIEASRKLAERLLRERGTDADRIAYAFRLATARLPRSAEAAALAELLEAQRRHYSADRASALKLLAVGESPRDEALEPAELAAWTMVASAILNLDETVTKG